MTVVPPLTPHTSPVPGSTVATPVLLLLHAPGPVASLSVMNELTQTAPGPVIDAGNGFTVTVAVAAQILIE